jgi:hypothetical protein
VKEALEKFLDEIRQMVMSSYDEEAQLDIPPQQKEGEKRDYKFIRYDKGPCTCEGQLNAWRKWTKDQGVTVHMV